jgi:gamma-glutamyltranspeptidase/glutathione hydrolase
VDHGAGGAVAAGDVATARAGAALLEAGGTAADAVCAALLAACVAEPGLASLGGGGFALVSEPGRPPVLHDFFVAAPGLGPERPAPPMVDLVVRFAGAEQVFRVGAGSVATPGLVPGILHVHTRHGRAPLPDVVGPAQALAVDGVALSPHQAAVLTLLRETVLHTPGCAALYAPAGEPLAAGDPARNPELARVLEGLGDGEISGWADLAGPLLAAGSGLTRRDLDSYAVVEREPLAIDHRGARVLTNPAPAYGGRILAGALSRLPGRFDAGPDAYAALAQAIAAATAEGKRLGPAAVRGTTHVSAVDAAGMVVSATISNGSCSGVVAPGTGIHLNNVMGEDDLLPHGGDAVQSGARIGSMMSPSVLALTDGSRVALGSGGSERIRSAITQAVLQIADRGLDLRSAVLAPRIHPHDGVVQAEPGLPPAVLAALRALGPVAEWPAPDLYFGGVHAVLRRADGTAEAFGDPRRGGAAVVLAS